MNAGEGRGNCNTSQSVPCGALLVRCCLGGHEGHGDPGGTGTGYRSLTSLKSISWQLAGGKLAISNHQVPDHFAHIFQKKKKKRSCFSQSALPCVRPGLGTLQNNRVCRVAPRLWKSPASLTWATSDLHPSRPPGSPRGLRVTVKTRETCLYRSPGARNPQLIHDF